MSENYGPCLTCLETGKRKTILDDILSFETCWVCGGTGRSGDIEDLLNPQPDSSPPPARTLFRPHAIEKAVDAFEHFLLRET